MAYALFNKSLNVYLEHPAIGIWSTNSYQEALDMLETCVSYVKTFNSKDENNFIIVPLQEEECILEFPPLVKI